MVAAATGAVGSVVGQIAKLKGCRVVGIAGGAEKCNFALETLGFDACIDHRDPILRELLGVAAPKGIDVYIENVGGAVLAAVLPLLNAHARVPVCGVVAWYNLAKLPEGVDRTPALMTLILRKRLRVQGFIIFDHFARMPAFYQEMSACVRDGVDQIPRGDAGGTRAGAAGADRPAARGELRQARGARVRKLSPMSEATEVFWIYDVISPFAYLALPELARLPEGIELKAVPVLFAGLLEHFGQRGPAEIPSKRRFTSRGRARRLQLPMRSAGTVQSTGGAAAYRPRRQHGGRARC